MSSGHGSAPTPPPVHSAYGHAWPTTPTSNKQVIGLIAIAVVLLAILWRLGFPGPMVGVAFVAILAIVMRLKWAGKHAAIFLFDVVMGGLASTLALVVVSLVFSYASGSVDFWGIKDPTSAAHKLYPIALIVKFAVGAYMAGTGRVQRAYRSAVVTVVIAAFLGTLFVIFPGSAPETPAELGESGAYLIRKTPVAGHVVNHYLEDDSVSPSNKRKVAPELELERQLERVPTGSARAALLEQLGLQIADHSGSVVRLEQVAAELETLAPTNVQRLRSAGYFFWKAGNSREALRVYQRARAIVRDTATQNLLDEQIATLKADLGL